LFVWERQMERPEIEALKVKLTGLGEIFALKLINYEDVWKVTTREAKNEQER